MKNEKVEPRPKRLLNDVSRSYPDAWKLVDSFREDKGKGLPSWSDWCFIPMAVGYAIASNGKTLSFDHAGDVSAITALATWRISQGIYRFDETLFESLINTEINGDLPTDVLQRLPEWCVYIDTPDTVWHGVIVHGFFAHLEHDMNDGHYELRLLFDSENGLIPIPIHLGGTLKEGLKMAVVQAQKEAWKLKAPKVSDLISDALGHCDVSPFVSLLLYLCSENADINNPPSSYPKATKTKKGMRFFPARKIKEWDVGVRMGAAIRDGLKSAKESNSLDKNQEGKRPHIRRAHWHTYRIGAGRINSIVKWLPPVAINVTDFSALPSVYKDVT